MRHLGGRGPFGDFLEEELLIRHLDLFHSLAGTGAGPCRPVRSTFRDGLPVLLTRVSTLADDVVCAPCPPTGLSADDRPELATRYRAEGGGPTTPSALVVERAFVDSPGLDVRIWSDTRPAETTIGDVAVRARELAGGLLARGIGPGDVVAFQLPNWLEAAITFYAVALTGATLVPIVHFYGPHEVGYVLRESQAAPCHHRPVRPPRLPGRLDELRPGLPDLETVAIVGDGPLPRRCDRLRRTVRRTGRRTEPRRPRRAGCRRLHVGHDRVTERCGPHPPHPRSPRSTRSPRCRPPGAPPILNGAPVGHAIGMQAGLLLPLTQGLGVYLTDVWDPARVLAAMLECRRHVGCGLHLLPAEPARRPDVHHRTPRADGRRRPRWCAGARPRSSTGPATSASRSCAPTAPPSTRRPPAAPTTTPTRSAATPTVVRCRASSCVSSTRPVVRWPTGHPGRDPESRPGPVRRLHRSRVDRDRGRRRRLVLDRRRRRARRQRRAHHHRPDQGHHHPRRREHQRGRGRGADRAHPRRRRGRGRGRARRSPRRTRLRVRPSAPRRDTPRPRRDARPPRDATASPGRSGRRSSGSSTPSRERRRARSRSSSSATPSAPDPPAPSSPSSASYGREDRTNSGGAGRGATGLGGGPGCVRR